MLTTTILRKSLLLGVGLIVPTVITLSSLPANATVLTFDDLTGFSGPIPNGYGGLDWSNFYYLDTTSFTPSGYVNGTVSQPKVAFNAFGAPATVSSSNPFTFNGAYLTGSWNNGLNINVSGYLGGILQDSQTVTVNTTAPTWFNFNYVGIDSLTFTSSGGTSAGYGGLGTHFALDNFTYNAVPKTVPEPSAVLGLLAIGGLGLVSLKRKQS